MIDLYLIMISKIGKGFRFAKREHIWEKRTNGVIIISISISCTAYYFDIYPAEISIFFFLIIGFTHGIARFCHKMEQHYLKDMRHPKSKP